MPTSPDKVGGWELCTFKKGSERCSHVLARIQNVSTRLQALPEDVKGHVSASSSVAVLLLILGVGGGRGEGMRKAGLCFPPQHTPHQEDI